MANMDIYNAVRDVPTGAIKTIKGGRLNGFSDINPMWRIQKLTETFGPCGIGWYYEVTNKEFKDASNGETAVFVDINLYVNINDHWSMPIYGNGGNKFVTNESKGAYVSDEAVKMAVTDALGSACKLLGFGADIYWANGATKYTTSAPVNATAEIECKCVECGKEFTDYTTSSGTFVSAKEVTKRLASKCKDGKPRCTECAKKAGMLNG